MFKGAIKELKNATGVGDSAVDRATKFSEALSPIASDLEALGLDIRIRGPPSGGVLGFLFNWPTFKGCPQKRHPNVKKQNKENKQAWSLQREAKRKVSHNQNLGR